jgi:hypothetical protein
MVAQARFKGHTFFGELNRPHDPAVHDHGAGTVEEYGMALTPPIGYAQAKAGEGFLKIGVGVLAKNKEKDAYSFAGQYRVLDSPAWRIKTEKAAIEFAQTASLPAGLAYEYVKRVELTESGFKIVRRLKNSGWAKWATDHYGHNYIVIDDKAVGPDYGVTLPFAAKVEEQNATKLAVASEKSIRPNRELAEREALWARASGHGDSPGDNEMRVENRAAKAGVEISTDLPMKRFVLYAQKSAFCPESFVEFALEPGETKEWTTAYRFFVMP